MKKASSRRSTPSAPRCKSDGGDIVLQGLDETASCTSSSSAPAAAVRSSTMTLKAGVERIIMDRVPGVTEPSRPSRRRADARQTSPGGQRSSSARSRVTGCARPAPVTGRSRAGRRRATALVCCIPTAATPGRSGSRARPARASRPSPTGWSGCIRAGTARSRCARGRSDAARSAAARFSATECACKATRPIPASSSARWRARGHLGGLAVATPQAVRVLDAVGKPWVIIETVGVGQVEVEIAGAGRHDGRRREPRLGRRQCRPRKPACWRSPTCSS